jgi:multiple sugar transport system ATP-binding protein
MNFLVGTVQNGHLKSPQFDLAPNDQLGQKIKAAEGKKVYVGIRPENLGLRGNTSIPEGQNVIKAQIEVVEPLGAETHILASVGGDQTIVARIDAHAKVSAGDQVELLADLGFLHAFDLETEANLRFA